MKSVEIVKPEVAAAATTATTQVKVEFYNDLESDNTYTFEVEVNGEIITQTLDFVIGEATTIELAAQSIKAEQAVAYKVLDENGLDVTSRYEVEVQTDNDIFTTSKGSVTVDRGATGSSFVKFAIKNDAGKVIASSNQVKITVATAKATSVADYWSLTSNSDTLLTKSVYGATTYKQDSSINLDSPAQYLNVSVFDQFGDDNSTSVDVTYESLDTDVAVVDKNTGKVTARSEGVVPVRVTLTDTVQDKVIATEVIELTVAAKAKLTGVELSENAVSLTTTSGVDTEDVTFKVLDQFGDEFTLSTETVKVESSKDSVATATLNGDKVEITAQSKGTATITLTVGNVKKEITVNVVEAGDTVDYEVTGFKSELLYEDVVATENVEEDLFELVVKGVDENSVATDILTFGEYTVEVTDKNGDPVVQSSGEFDVADYKGEEGPFTVTVLVGSLPVFTGEFKVTDNRVAPEFSIVDNDLVFTSSNVTTGSVTAIDEDIEALLDFDVEDDAVVDVTAVDFVSKNEMVINSLAAVTDGSTQILVDTVTVSYDKDGSGTDYAAETFELDLNGEIFNVLVDTTAPTAEVSHANENFGTAAIPVNKAVTTIAFSEAISEFTVKSGADGFKFVVQTNGTVKAYNGATEVTGTTEAPFTGYTKFTHPVTSDTVVVKYDSTTKTLKAAWGHDLVDVPAIFGGLELKAKDLVGNESTDLAVVPTPAT